MSSAAELQSQHIKTKGGITKKLTPASIKDAKAFQKRNDGKWVDDSTVSTCMKCAGKFTVTNRKHHCRECGGVFCQTCSAFKIVIEGSLKRACADCYRTVIETTNNSSSLGFKHSTNTTGITDSQISNSIGSAPVLDKPVIPVPNITDNSTITYIDKNTESKENSTQKTAIDPGSAVVLSPEAIAYNARLPPWVEGVVFVSKNSVSNPIQEVYPTDALPAGMLADINSLALPDSLRGGSKVQELSYMFRCRDRSQRAKGGADVFYNCYVSYKQKSLVSSTDKSTNLFRQALVIVSRWPYPQLAFMVLDKLDEALFWQVGSSNSTTASDEASSPENIQALLMAAYGQLVVWPKPQRKMDFSLPFLGEMLQYATPYEIYAKDGVNLNLGVAFDGVNLISMFAPLGLLQHIWMFWELVISGKNIVIFATSPTQCSQVTIALASLLSPFSYDGQLRPYITIHDADVAILSKNAKNHSSGRGAIVGITDASLLNNFEHFDIALFLGSQKSNVETDSIFKGLHSKNSALVKHIKGKSEGVSPHNSFPSMFEEWISGTGSAGSGDWTLPWVVCNKITPKAKIDRSKILKIRKMKARDRCVLGDKVVRDNLKTLTAAFQKSVTGASGVDDINPPCASVTPADEALPAVSDKPSAVVKSGTLTDGASENAKMNLESIKQFIIEFPTWAPDNKGTLVLWTMYLIVCVVLPRLVGLPALPLIIAAYFFKVPTTPPKQMADALLKYAPALGNKGDVPAFSASKPSGGKMSTSDARKTVPKTKTAAANHPDMTGVWKRIKLCDDNLGEFVGSVGGSALHRKFALTMPSVHTITMDTARTTVRLQVKSGPVDSDCTYAISGPATLNKNLYGKEYSDVATWEEISSNDVQNVDALVITRLAQPGNVYQITEKRSLETSFFDRESTSGAEATPTPPNMRVEYVYTDLVGKKEPLSTVAIYRYVSESPNPQRPDSSPYCTPSGNAGDVTSTDTAPVKKHKGSAPSPEKSLRKDLSGIWVRSKTVNFDLFIGAQGAGYLQRKLAASMPITHTIAMDSSLRGFRLWEKGGPLDMDNSYTCGADYVTTQIVKNVYRDRVYWEGKDLVNQRIHDSGLYELETRRHLDEGNPDQLVLISTHRDLNTMEETVATSWFSKTGDAGITAPIPEGVEEIEDEGVGSDAGGDLDSADGEGSVDGDEGGADDDEVADEDVGGVPAAIRATLGATAAPTGVGLTRTVTTGAVSKSDFSGIWKRTSAANFEAFVGAQGAGYVQRKLAASMQLTHIITMNPPYFDKIRLQEKGGPLDLDSIYDASLGGASAATPVERSILKKKYWDTCYWEGNAIILKRVHELNDYELILKRYLEDDGNTIRLVSVHHNLKTNEQVESISFFNKTAPCPHTALESFGIDDRDTGATTVQVEDGGLASTPAPDIIPAQQDVVMAAKSEGEIAPEDAARASVAPVSSNKPSGSTSGAGGFQRMKSVSFGENV